MRLLTLVSLCSSEVEHPVEARKVESSKLSIGILLRGSVAVKISGSYPEDSGFDSHPRDCYIAQVAEQFLHTEKVMGSSPFIATVLKESLTGYSIQCLYA